MPTRLQSTASAAPSPAPQSPTPANRPAQPPSFRRPPPANRPPGTRPVNGSAAPVDSPALNHVRCEDEVWWLVGPQGSGKSVFARKTIAEYEARGLIAIEVEEAEDFKKLIHYPDGVRRLRPHREPYSRLAVKPDLVMVPTYRAPNYCDRRFESRDRVIHFPLPAKRPAVAKASRLQRAAEWLRNAVAKISAEGH